MATKNSNTSTMNKNKETIKKVSSKVHEELLNTSHLFIDETVATLTRMQKITGKVIKKSEPILEKQIEITFDAVQALKNQAGKGGKRALKLLGLTKQYNKISNTIEEKVKEIPSVEEMFDDAKEFVGKAKSDVEEKIGDLTKMGKVEVIAKKAKKIVAKSTAVKTAKKAKPSVKKVVAKTKAAAKTTAKTVKSKVASKTVTAKTTVAKTKTAAKATVKTAKTKVAAKTATKKATVAKTTAPVKAVAKTVKTKVATKTTAKKATAAKTTSPVKAIAKTAKAKVATKTVAKKVTAAKTTAPVKAIAKTAKAKVATKTVAKKVTAPKAIVSELTQIKGIGASLAAIMTDNGIKTIKDLQSATPTALKIIAVKAGNRYKSFDTQNWITAAVATAK